jgi:hypothetical protein
VSRPVLPLYEGAIRAHEVGAFVMGGETFHIIRPGYCSQGRRRTTWTQIVHDDVPVFAVKVRTDLAAVIARFEAQWERHIRNDPAILAKALALCKGERRRKFRDGVTGESPAPASKLDSATQGVRYPA